MKLLWTERGWNDYLVWQQSGDKFVERINELIRDARRNSSVGIGKPEPLRGELSDWWSRRVSQEHRLIYRVSGTGEEQALEIAQCRSHYGR